MQRGLMTEDRWTAERWLAENERMFSENPSLPREEMRFERRDLDRLFDVAMRVGLGRGDRRPLDLSEAIDHLLDQLDGVGGTERRSGKPSRKVA